MSLVFDENRELVYGGVLTLKMKTAMIAAGRGLLSFSKQKGYSGAHGKTIRALWLHGLISEGVRQQDGSFNYVLSDRGIKTLKDAGLENA